MATDPIKWPAYASKQALVEDIIEKFRAGAPAEAYDMQMRLNTTATDGWADPAYIRDDNPA